MNRIRARDRLSALQARLRRGSPPSYALRRILRALFGKSSDRTNRKPVVAAVAAAVPAERKTQTEVQAPRVDVIRSQIRRRRPVAAVRAEVVKVRVAGAAEAGSGKEDTL